MTAAADKSKTQTGVQFTLPSLTSSPEHGDALSNSTNRRLLRLEACLSAPRLMANTFALAQVEDLKARLKSYYLDDKGAAITYEAAFERLTEESASIAVIELQAFIAPGTESYYMQKILSKHTEVMESVSRLVIKATKFKSYLMNRNRELAVAKGIFTPFYTMGVTSELEELQQPPLKAAPLKAMVDSQFGFLMGGAELDIISLIEAASVFITMLKDLAKLSKQKYELCADQVNSSLAQNSVDYQGTGVEPQSGGHHPLAGLRGLAGVQISGDGDDAPSLPTLASHVEEEDEDVTPTYVPRNTPKVRASRSRVTTDVELTVEGDVFLEGDISIDPIPVVNVEASPASEDGWGHSIQDNSVSDTLRELKGVIAHDKHEQAMDVVTPHPTEEPVETATPLMPSAQEEEEGEVQVTLPKGVKHNAALVTAEEDGPEVIHVSPAVKQVFGEVNHGALGEASGEELNKFMKVADGDDDTPEPPKVKKSRIVDEDEEEGVLRYEPRKAEVKEVTSTKSSFAVPPAVSSPEFTEEDEIEEEDPLMSTPPPPVVIDTKVHVTPSVVEPKVEKTSVTVPPRKLFAKAMVKGQTLKQLPPEFDEEDEIISSPSTPDLDDVM